MPAHIKTGFTLTEMMVVIVIIGVLSAIAIPSIIHVLHRNALSSMTNEIQQAAGNVRALAMKTRRASVLEVRQNTVWINLLAGSSCWDDILQRCMVYRDNSGANVIDLRNSTYLNADAVLCKGAALGVSGFACDSTMSAIDLNVSSGQGFAACYSGRGELFFRPSADSATQCTSSGAVALRTAWRMACGKNTATSTSIGPLFDGAVILLNRHQNRNCSNGALDVARMVYFPSSGAPFSKAGQ